MTNPSSDVAFSPAVKRVQTERGSRGAYQRLEARGGFRTAIDEDLREFLSIIDTAFLATASADGQPYVQHRGGGKGFIKVVDDTTLAIADLAGNRQYVTTGNLLENDRFCLFLIDYEQRGRIKVWGHARTAPMTPELSKLLGNPKTERVLLLTVTAWDGNCQQHIPQKLNAEDVAQAIETRDARIAQLEAELKKLKAS
jgi:predicted pyridoxine 5'-phosphate oxidase superfamily flavin-nucleotide-binding protein